MILRGAINTAYPMEHDAPLIAYVSRRCHLFGFQEARHRNGTPLIVAPLLPADWGTNQVTTNGETSATGFAWAPDVKVAVRRALAAAVTRKMIRRLKGRKIQPRYISEVVTVDPHTGVRCHEISIHIPLDSTRVQRAAVARLAARVRWLRRYRPHEGIVVYCDANMPLRRLARWTGLDAVGPNVGHRIVGHLVSRNVHVEDVTPDDHVERAHWTDHPLMLLKAEARLAA